MKKLILIFTALLLFTACNKAKYTVLNGQVRTFGSQEAIQHPPVKVQILHQEFASVGIGGSYTYTPVAETWTDQDGYFTIDADLRKNDSYFLGVDPETVKESYHYASPSYGMIDFSDHLITERGGTFTKNHSLVGYGWVRFHFISTNPQPGDIYGYNLGGGQAKCFMVPLMNIAYGTLVEMLNMR